MVGITTVVVARSGDSLASFVHMGDHPIGDLRRRGLDVMPEVVACKHERRRGRVQADRRRQRALDYR
jgi:hypothetical protein